MPKGLKIMNSLARLMGRQPDSEVELESKKRKPAALLGLEKAVSDTDQDTRKKIQDSFNKKLGR